MGAGGSRRHELCVSEEEAGSRLDRFLASRIPDQSRSYLSRLIREGAVRVDGRSAKAGQALKAGQSVTLIVPAPQPLELVPEDIPLDIIFEDEHLAVVDKPAGMVTHPAAGNRDGTLVHALLHHLDRLAGIGGRLRPGIVHRLDKDTSGLLLVAKSDRAHRRLVEMIAAREIRRNYLALVWGHLAEGEGVIDAAVGRDRVHRKKMAVLPEGGRSAVTRYLRVDTYPGFDYIRLELETGRTHQIRVHMAHMGHPVLGDPLYGGRRSHLRGRTRAEVALCREVLAVIKRQALHACRLGFVHPISGEGLTFESPLPQDMQSALDLVSGRRKPQGEAQ